MTPNSGQDLSAGVPAANREAARLLEHIAGLLATRGDNAYRVRAYEDAAATIGSMSADVADLWKRGELRSIRGVGPSIAAKLDQFLRSGHSNYLDELRLSTPRGIEQLLNVPGVGPARARVLAERLGVHTPEELAEAARAGRVRELPGFGEKVERRLLAEAERWARREKRFLVGVAWPVAENLADQLRRDPAFCRVSTAGSLRRRCETIGDVDLLAASTQPEVAADHFVRLPIVREVLELGPTLCSVLLQDGLQVDLRIVGPGAWGSALQHFTGSKQHNVALRDLAIGKGLRLNEDGIFDEATGKRLGGKIEEDVYRVLGMPWIPPELREDRGEIAGALENRLPSLVECSDLCGDLHVHTDWSDGTADLEAMALAARDAGLQYVAITDHTPSLVVANGLSLARLREQGERIDELNHRLTPFRIFRGAEVDILVDGALDLPDDVLAGLDYVGVSVHSKFRLPRDEQTRRIIRAIRHPAVVTLNHPTGRLLNRRAGYEVDLEAILRVAAHEGVAVEINGQPDRLDLDDVWARRAKDLGCRLVLDSDAHGTAGFANLRYAVAVARRAWLTRADVANTLPLDKLIEWFNGRKRRSAA